MIFLFAVTGCYGSELTDSAEDGIEKKEKDEAAGIEPSMPLDLKTDQFSSEDGLVTVKVEKVFIDELIAEEIDQFFSEEPDQENEVSDRKDSQSVYYEDTHLQPFDEEVLFITLFISILSIEEGFIKNPHGFEDEQPVLITAEKKAYERTIMQFKYTGDAGEHASIRVFPEGSKGVLVFAYPSGETPQEVLYIFSLQHSKDSCLKRSKVVIPIGELVL